MERRRFNWAVWTGFGLSVAAFLSYPFFFVRFPVTRDFPWANLLLFGVAAIFVVFGVRRAFWTHPTRNAKIGAGVAATVSAAVLVLFVLGVFVLSRHLPASQGAPKVGQKAPDFTLADENGKPTSLSELLTFPVNGRAPKAVLLVFYRGYW